MVKEVTVKLHQWSGSETIDSPQGQYFNYKTLTLYLCLSCVTESFPLGADILRLKNNVSNILRSVVCEWRRSSPSFHRQFIFFFWQGTQSGQAQVSIKECIFMKWPSGSAGLKSPTSYSILKQWIAGRNLTDVTYHIKKKRAISSAHRKAGSYTRQT